jgi:hypothetical protein
MMGAVNDAGLWFRLVWCGLLMCVILSGRAQVVARAADVVEVVQHETFGVDVSFAVSGLVMRVGMAAHWVSFGGETTLEKFRTVTISLLIRVDVR